MNIDFHAHILPGADHGSRSLETSLQQIALAKEAGIDILAATPHFYPKFESIADFLERRKQAEIDLLEARNGDLPRLIVGAETHLCRGLQNMESVEQLCFRGTKVLLVELPHDFSLRAYEPTLDALVYEKKLKVVLAHIDRYPTETIESLLEMGLLAQVNADSFCRLRSRKRSMAWATGLKSVVALGSDLHGTEIGYRNFLRMKERLGDTYRVIMNRTQELLGIE